MFKTVLKTGAVICALAALCVLYGLLIEPNRLVVRNVDITPDETMTGEGVTRIVHISDIHIGALHVDLPKLKQIIDRANAQNADMIILTGDYIAGHEPRDERTEEFNAVMAQGLTMMGALRAPSGVYAVLGNHDNWYDGPFVAGKLRAAGITVLNNAHAMTSGGLCIVGLADHDTDIEDPTAFDACGGSPTIAAMHSPDSFAIMPKDTALALAGHTHGGQVNLPLLGRRVTATQLGRPYAYGRKDWKGTPVYISSGIGTSILPVRFRAPPEIAVITLHH